MKNLIIFILFSAIGISNSLACGPFYSSDEDIRFSILNPDCYGFKGFSSFYYSAQWFYSNDDDINYDKNNISTAELYNVDLWQKRCKNIPTKTDVFEAVYIIDEPFNSMKTSNTFIQYLQKNKDEEAIKYLAFAKNCSVYNSFFDDPWERNDVTRLPKRTNLIEFAISKTESLNDEDLKLRYAFIAIRLAYYNGDYEIIKTLYSRFFEERENKNIIDYWSMYFRTRIEPEGGYRNYLAAQVYQNAPDKRFMIYSLYDRSVPIFESLKFAKNNREKAAVWFLKGIRSPAQALDCIENMYKLDPESEGLAFLLSREVNKLEDWLFTPYYTSFSPSVYIESEEDNSIGLSAKRIKSDQVYAQKLLDFISSVTTTKVNNLLVWQLSKAYLIFMTEKYDASLNELNSLLKQNRDNQEIIKQVEAIKALCLLRLQENNNAGLNEELQQILMHQLDDINFKLIFAIARELEFKGNTTEAALLLSTLNSKNNEWWEDAVFWKTRKGHHTLYADFYNDYFFYLDAQYTPEQVQELIHNIENNKAVDELSKWKFKGIKQDVSRLYDLLGTKYMRHNNLSMALKAFRQVDDKFWSSGEQAFHIYLAANPFYTNMYAEHVKTKADTIKYNKAGITKTLINFLKMADDVNNPDRDYYYFLAANCYFNMTQYGNSWMMKRYYWTMYNNETKLEDDNDYFNCNLAKQYYLKAKAVSKSKRFAALCLRMAGRCEKYRLYNTNQDLGKLGTWSETDDIWFNSNVYYKQLNDNYPDYFDDLISNCESFDRYFKARKQ